MINELHETLVDEIRFSFGDFLYENGCDLWGNVGFAAEAIVANVLTGLVGIGLIAGGYIFTNDGYGVIPVEFGICDDGRRQSNCDCCARLCHKLINWRTTFWEITEQPDR